VPTRRDFLKRTATIAGSGLVAAACDPREYARRHGATLRISIAAGNVGGVYYPYGGAVAALITRYVPNVAATAEVTGGSIDNMQFIRQGTADLGFSTADMLSEAFTGTGEFAKTGRVPVRTLAVLYFNYVHVVTLESTGVRTLQDLRGKVVSVGSAGSATEIAALRILRAAGLDPTRDVTRQGLGVGAAGDALRDGKIDALFWSGGVPTGAILELAASPGHHMVLVPVASCVPALQREYGASIYLAKTIGKGAYPGLTEDIGVVGMANMLGVDARMSDDLAYEITRAIFEHRDDLATVHAEAKNLSPESAVQGSGVDFHPGAIRYYAERGVWKS
jgi:TRAP transporter TAXI family solute receptor